MPFKGLVSDPYPAVFILNWPPLWGAIKNKWWLAELLGGMFCSSERDHAYFGPEPIPQEEKQNETIV